ncbi:abhydrolase domain-containing protein 15 [Elysia marginata]|uniref:Abhydrolase domain-containing protein 15 n=1 Tax=Elysia marginata TaxID=1093978 RepID=A0AAV4G4I4_9GAST|nr:abhydrolase domain-containing protein 15 [Elysia marginata]
MLEIVSYLSLLPFPVCVAVFGSVLLSIGVCLRGFSIMTAPEIPKLYFRESSLNTYIIDKCNMRSRSFSPSFWFSSRHLQTWLPIILPKPEVTFERQYLQMRDKGVVALDWVVLPHTKTKNKRATVILVIPTLTGGACHVTPVCHAAATRGMRTVVFNRRGHGGTLLTTPKLQSFGDPNDLRQVIKYIRLCWPRSPLAAVAYGTGCGLLMSYLGEFGSSALLTSGACVSPCWDTPERFLSSGPRGVYDLLLLLRLKTILYRHAPALDQVVDTGRALVSAWSLPEFDQAVYCPLYGYKDLNHFWEVNNPIRDVDDIEVPVLCVNSLDDPVAGCSGNDNTSDNTSIPYDLFKCYPNFLLAITRKGGHCGFLDGFPPKSWADELCLDHIEAVVEFTQKCQLQQLPHQKQQQQQQPPQHSGQQQIQTQQLSHQSQPNQRQQEHKAHAPHILHRYHSTSSSHLMSSNNNFNIGSIISSITGRSDSISSGQASLSHTHRSLSNTNNQCLVSSRYIAISKKRSSQRFTI